MGRRLYVYLTYDESPENPCEFGTWELFSFCRRHYNHKHPYEFFDEETGKPNEEFQSKLDNGTAFLLSYFEHGNCSWSLMGDRALGTEGDWRWDGVDLAGVLIRTGEVDDSETEEYLRKWACYFLETYTYWCNGECYCFKVESDEGDHIDSCCGYYGSEDLESALGEVIKDGDEVVLKGNCKDLGKYLDLPWKIRDCFPTHPKPEYSI